MLVEKILFTILAFSLFIIVCAKIFRKNDTSYIYIAILQFVGILIDFIEIKYALREIVSLLLIRYLFSVILPVLIILLEKKNINFNEIFTIFLARIFVSAGNTRTAKKMLLNFIKSHPKSYMAHKLLGQIYEKEGGIRRAIDEYVAVIDIDNSDYKTYFKIATLLKESDKKDEAIEMLRNLNRAKPEFLDASLALGDLLCEQERFKEAANVYMDALRYHPAEFELYYSLGIVYTMLSDFQTAKEMYERAAEINHRLYMAYYSLGIIALFDKDLDMAREYFQEAIYEELEPKAYYQLAKIYMIKNEKDMAISFLNKAIELDNNLLAKAQKDPTFEEIKQYIALSVNMDDTEKKKTLTQREFEALQVLEETIFKIDCMNSNTAKQKIDEKVNAIFDREKMKKIQEQEEAENIMNNQIKNKDNKD